MPEAKQLPQNVRSNEIFQAFERFEERIKSLRQSLGLAMRALFTAARESDKEFDEFAKKYCETKIKATSDSFDRSQRPIFYHTGDYEERWKRHTRQ